MPPGPLRDSKPPSLLGGVRVKSMNLGQPDRDRPCAGPPHPAPRKSLECWVARFPHLQRAFIKTDS